VASVHAQTNRSGRTYRVFWRDDGRQQSLTFADRPSADRFKTLVEDHGASEAKRILEIEETGRHVPTVSEWLTIHIDGLTGVQPATINRYRTYVLRDIDPVFGRLPINAVTEATIGAWVQQLRGAGKTIQNKHGFLSGAFNAAVRRGLILANPCQGRRLPRTETKGDVFLTQEEFKLLHSCIPHDRWQKPMQYDAMSYASK
jgi:hypothetical protein